MKKVDYEIVIPIYNEGINVIRILRLFDKFIKYKIRVILCYDLDDDDIFQYNKLLKKFKFDVLLLKNKKLARAMQLRAA